jgi:ribosome-binding factor A
MMKESNRQKKFGKLLQKELSEIFQREILLEGAPMLTVTVVRATPDLRMARIFISVFPDDKGPAAILEVEKKNREIRHTLSQRIKTQVRYMPELNFFLDDTLIEVEKMEGLLGSIRNKPTTEE